MQNEKLASNEGDTTRKTVDDFSNWVGLKTRDGMHKVVRVVDLYDMGPDIGSSIRVQFMPPIDIYHQLWVSTIKGEVYLFPLDKWIDLTPIQEPQFDYPETALVQDEKTKKRKKVYLYEGNVAFSEPLIHGLTPIGSAWVTEGEFAND